MDEMAAGRSAEARAELLAAELLEARARVRALEEGSAEAGLLGEGAALPARGAGPRAWEVRAFVGSGGTEWRVFCPAWAAGRRMLYPAGMGAGWNALAVAAAGTLYAALTWVGTRGADGSVAWAAGSPEVTADLAGLPADAEPGEEAGDASGRRSVAVAIGRWVAAGGGARWEQWHVGAVVEAGPWRTGGAGGGLPDGAVAWGRVEAEEVRDGSSSSGGALTGYRIWQWKQAWDAEAGAFREVAGSRTLVAELEAGGGAGGACVGPLTVEGGESGAVLRQYYGTMAGGAFVSDGRVASEIPLYGHAEDHTEGVL